MILSELVKTLEEKIAKFGDFEIDHIDIGDNGIAEIWVVTENENGKNSILIDEIYNY
jgi:hypothetical protein